MPLVRPRGFPWLPPGLTYWLCGLGTVEQARRESWLSSSVFFLFFFVVVFKKALILLSGSESYILQCDASPEEVGGRGVLGNRRGRGGGGSNSLLLCAVLILGVK